MAARKPVWPDDFNKTVLLETIHNPLYLLQV